MASNDTFVFSEPDLQKCSFSMFYNMKKNGELSDISIRIDNRVFAAHRIILAAAIPYFRTMFTSGLAETLEKEVTMKGLDPVALEFLIDFAYTSQVKITVENVQSLLVASEYLQLTKVRDSCCDFLSKRLDPNNVMKVRSLADSLNCLSLVENADIHIRKNFEAFSQTKEFLNLSFQFLNNLIRKDDLQVSSEESVYDAVMNWVKSDTKRPKMLPKLLTGVRMTFLTPEFLVKKVSKEKLIMDSVPCRNLLDEAKHYHLLPEEGAFGCSFTVSERCSGGCGIYIFCCNGTNGLTILKYITTSQKWITVLNDKSRSDLKHVLAVGGEIYVFRNNTFETFNPQTLKWALKKFPGTYSNFKHAVSWKGKIYWFGSKDKYEGLFFDNNQNTWDSYAHRNMSIFADDEILPIGNSVYVFGSLSRLNNSGRRNVKFDFQSHAICAVSDMQNPRYAFGSTVLDDTAYVCGGIRCNANYYGRMRRNANFHGLHSISMENDSVLRSTETYSSSRGWRTASSMIKERKNFSLVTYNKKLYAIGGTTEASSLVEVYDPASDKWTLVGYTLSGQYDFLKAVVISDEGM